MRGSTLVVAVLLALIGVGGAAAPASAHASLVSTDPAEGAVLAEAPESVTFTFNERVALVPRGIAVFDATGAEVDVDDTTASDDVVTVDLPDLADGTHVVVWRIVSADGHPVSGSLTFHVGAPSERVEPPGVSAPEQGALPIVRALLHAVGYLGLLLAAGLAIFLGWISRGTALPPDLRRRVVRLLTAAAGVAMVAAAVSVPVAGAYQLGGGMAGIIDPASFDLSLVGDDLLVLAMQVVGLSAAVWSARTARSLMIADLLTAMAVFSPALVGHTRGFDPSSLLVVTDALHLAAGAVWLGGLVGLVVVLPRLAGRPRDAAALLARFSQLAALLLGLVAVTGLLLGWRILGSWAGLVEETYGRLLLAKGALVLVVVALAAYNRFRLLPAACADDGHDARRAAIDRVRRTVACEAAVLVAVLGVTGFLTQNAPVADSTLAATADTGTASAVVDAGDQDLRVLAVLGPGPGLQRRLIVQLQDMVGDPVDLYDAPAARLRSDAVDLGDVPLVAAGSGTYAADVVLPTTGAWELQVSVRVDEFTTPVAVLDLEVE